ncbi:hypothetical protein GQ43DRAFT_413753 [Delitschia confertaspora ATCC 74209]|uniref:Distal membrane-arm assembly complex protein 1-like domain-containing protein n=1 Tax=Delitschia confertaspora ATCC 74209 TaxID=1513339 RepID=A0A9P4JQ94_9PLEO|nr:hypothetical protein GQ43DRAFT_413753 [Delitschia confertaspora ATCC 74209]
MEKENNQYEDCTPCRIIGTGAFLGLGVFTYVSGHRQLREQEAIIRQSKGIFGMAARRAGITGLAATMMGVGAYRWFS